jgi:hypothetical protein
MKLAEQCILGRADIEDADDEHCLFCG